MKRTTIIFSGLMFASLAVAADQAPTQKSAPASEGLDFPLGDWTCTGNLMAMDKEPGHATRAKVRSEKILDGNWIVIHYDEERTSENPQPYRVVQHIGYDKAKKQLVSVTLDNMSSGYTLGTTTGWKNDVLTVDEAQSPTSKLAAYRDVFTRKGSDALTHTGTLKGKDGTSTKTDEETCRKS